MAMFRYEEDLIITFLDQLDRIDSNWIFERMMREFNFKNGKTDLVGLQNGSLTAFEAKLTNWKKAVNQAYRNTIYADFSYVVLPMSIQNTVSKNIDYFGQHGVGLILVDQDNYQILLEAEQRSIGSNWIVEKAFCSMGAERNEIRVCC